MAINQAVELVEATVKFEIAVVIGGSRQAVQQFLRIGDGLFGVPGDWAIQRFLTGEVVISDAYLKQAGESPLPAEQKFADVSAHVRPDVKSWRDAAVKPAGFADPCVREAIHRTRAVSVG